MRINKKKSISIIIPVFNSQATIYLLIKNLIAELDKNLEFEIIIINDNSTDSSESECIKAYNDFFGKVKFFAIFKSINFSIFFSILSDSLSPSGPNNLRPLS